MADSNKIESVVEHAVGEVLNSMLPGLQQQIVTQVLTALQPALQEKSGGTAVDAHDLTDALAGIHAGTTQVQILDALVDGTASFVARAAMFVVRGHSAVGWRARGFAEDDIVRNSPVDLDFGMPAKAVKERVAVTGAAADFAREFTDNFGTPVEGAIVFPLVVRDKVVAILYVDGGCDTHRLDRVSVETLVRCTGIWLEVFATRKVTAPAHETEPAMPSSKARAVAAVASAPAVASVAPAAAPTPMAHAAVAVEAAPEAAPVPAPVPAVTPVVEDEVHKKARRFAKLLVDEIKLYNQAKVSEGRQHRDLYDRLKEDIEKSRASYDKRYGTTSAKDSDYFNEELVRILADNDPSLLGGNFPR
jgi:hypothetical protein